MNAINIKIGPSAILTSILKEDSNAFAIVKPGDLVEGRVLEKGANMLLVDLGRNGTGVVYRGEMQNAREMIRGLGLGDTMHAKVVEVDNEDGYVELSLAEAGRQKAWAAITEIAEKGEAFPVKITGANKGGLTTEIAGIAAFLPVSHLANDHYPKIVEGSEKTSFTEEIAKFVGQEFSVKIVDANPRTGKLIVSEREAQEVNTREFIKNYTVGQVIEGIVCGVADFGAFVKFTDNPAVEGLIHISELDHRVVENPKDVIAIDDVVKVKIIDIKEGKITLSLKALQNDPWDTWHDNYKEGDELVGTVVTFNPFGALVNLSHGFQGHVHVTSFGSIDEMKKHLAPRQEYTFVVENVKVPEKRITLKLKS